MPRAGDPSSTSQSLKIEPLESHHIKFTDQTFRLNQFLSLKYNFHAREVVVGEGQILFVLEPESWRKYTKRGHLVRGMLERNLGVETRFVLYSRSFENFLLNFFRPVPVVGIHVDIPRGGDGGSDPKEVDPEVEVGVQVENGFYGRAVGRRGHWIKMVSRYFAERYPVSRVYCFESSVFDTRPRCRAKVMGVDSQTSRLSSGRVS
ncbi:MAG: hypothetical protein ACTSU5_15300 [Promethearchaeota archaeon]